MALTLSHPNPLGLLDWEDGFKATTVKMRGFKSYLAGDKLALVSADTVEVVRVRFGGFDHRKTTKSGTQLSMLVDPPRSIWSIGGIYTFARISVFDPRRVQTQLTTGFRFFAKIQEGQDWRSMGCITPVYERMPPYPRVGSFANVEPLITSPTPRLIWTERVATSVYNITSITGLLLLRKSAWLHTFLFWIKTVCRVVSCGVCFGH